MGLIKQLLILQKHGAVWGIVLKDRYKRSYQQAKNTIAN
jgi:hypothetical protein